jgi:predicted outer membrane protein
VDDQVKGHEKTIALFQQAAASNSDPDLRNFAQSNLPTLQHHLQMAEKDSSIINEPAGAAKNGTYTQ